MARGGIARSPAASREWHEVTYYAYSIAVEEEGSSGEDSVVITLDAVPKDSVGDYLRRLFGMEPTSDTARDIQREFQREFQDEVGIKGVVINGVFRRNEDDGRDIRFGGFRPDHWYSVTLSEGGDLRLWPMDDLVGDDTPLVSFTRVRTLRGRWRTALDNLFTLRGTRRGDGPGTPPDPRVPSDGAVQPKGAVGSPGPTAGNLDRHALVRFMSTASGTASRRFVGVLDIGQGSCAAVYDEHLRPVVYVDFGFPTKSNVLTAPWNLNYLTRHHVRGAPHGLDSENLRHSRPCLCVSPLVVLSHGHHDHWYGLNLIRQDVIDRRLPVLGPSPLTAPALSGLWGRLPETDTVASDDWRSFPWGWVVGCRGNRTNDTGLAVFVRVRDDASNPSPVATKWGEKRAGPNFTRNEQYVLLPGDAMFSVIPGLDDPDLRLVGLIASHHGATFNSKDAFDRLPTPCHANSPIVYSYGLHDSGLSECMPPDTPPDTGLAVMLNGYWNGAAPAETQRRCYVTARGGHPRQDAIDIYMSKGWTERRNTAREEGAARNTGQGNWLIGSRGFKSRYQFRIVEVCASPSCPENKGCRASEFRVA